MRREDEEDLSILRTQPRGSTYSRSFGSGNAIGSWVTLVRRWYCHMINSQEPTQPSHPLGQLQSRGQGGVLSISSIPTECLSRWTLGGRRQI